MKNIEELQKDLKNSRRELADVDGRIAKVDQDDEARAGLLSWRDMVKALIQKTENQIAETVSDEMIVGLANGIMDAYAVYFQYNSKRGMYPSLQAVIDRVRANAPLSECEGTAVKRRAEKILLPYLK
jgi:hypothetical protein